MTVFVTPKEMRHAVVDWRAAGETVCLVPTMGSIHAGHLALIDTAKQTADRVVVSIYVNPTQFAAGEDFDGYPRDIQTDLHVIMTSGGVDAIYAPSAMYSKTHATSIVPSGVALPMEGLTRPHFFTGVATIVFKLFQHVPSDYAVFGEKDFQQFSVLQQMVSDLDLPISLIAHPTIREADGLALSSRNHYLSENERIIAPAIYRTLRKCAKEIMSGRSIDDSLDTAKAYLFTAGFDKIDYLDLREAESLTISTTARPKDRLFIAAWLGQTRLIDNFALGRE